jgi:ribosomal protein S21
MTFREAREREKYEIIKAKRLRKAKQAGVEIVVGSKQSAKAFSSASSS